MIAEAVDAAIAVGWALLAWLVVFAVAATVAGFTLVAAPVVAWQAVTRDCAAGLAVVRGFGGPEAGRGAERGAGGRTGPTWARTDNIGKEAA